MYIRCLGRLTSACLLMALGQFGAWAQPAGSDPDDWHRLWLKNGEALPSPETVATGSLAGLGTDLEDREWWMVRSRYHHLYYQPSTDANTVAEVFQLIDNLYDFLAARSPAAPEAPVLVFLVPGERGRSRCSREANAMRTGADADLPFIVGSLMHEETHLFNFAFLGERWQGWWTGEYACIYFQERARLTAEGADIKSVFASRLPKGPVGRLSELDGYNRYAFDEAFAAMFFLEETYGRDLLNEFRRQCLAASWETNGGPLPESLFKQVFDKDSPALDEEWWAFFGWPGKREIADPRLENKVTFATEQASVQYIVQDLAKQAGLGYHWEKSREQTDPLCRDFVRNVDIKDTPCFLALDEILEPMGLRYEVENNAIVLYRR